MKIQFFSERDKLEIYSLLHLLRLKDGFGHTNFDSFLKFYTEMQHMKYFDTHLSFRYYTSYELEDLLTKGYVIGKRTFEPYATVLHTQINNNMTLLQKKKLILMAYNASTITKYAHFKEVAFTLAKLFGIPVPYPIVRDFTVDELDRYIDDLTDEYVHIGKIQYLYDDGMFFKFKA